MGEFYPNVPLKTFGYPIRIKILHYVLCISVRSSEGIGTETQKNNLFFMFVFVALRSEKI